MKIKSTLFLRTSTLLASAQIIVGCQHIDVAQVTYEMLRAEDCRRNQLEDFCGRSYAFEYNEYVRMRRDFIRDEEQATQTEQETETTNGLTLHKVLNR